VSRWKEEIMMYGNKLAFAVKHNGKILRELNRDTVYVPFGAEYTILIKNLNNVRALVNITIDGTDAVEGGLVVDANREVELKRFVKNGNMTQGNSFKFIERTAGVEQHRGIGIEDGLIRVEYQFEDAVAYRPTPVWRERWVKDGYWDYETDRRLLGSTNTSYSGSGGVSGSLGDGLASMALKSYTAPTSRTLRSHSVTASASIANTTQSINVVAQNASLNDVGVTVPGSLNDQKFSQASWFPVEATKHVLVVKLLGETASGPVVQAVTVNVKPKCVTCGKQNKATSKFCTDCGTSLTIV
jgi:hypothetical protein